MSFCTIENIQISDTNSYRNVMVADCFRRMFDDVRPKKPWEI